MMNKKLQELANKAGYVDCGNNITAYIEFDHEMFAELIIRECAELCQKQCLHYSETNNRGSAASAADVCRIIIKQHFGVK